MKIKIKEILEIFCRTCEYGKHNCSTDDGRSCVNYDNLKQELKRYKKCKLKKQTKIVLCPNCLFVFDPKNPLSSKTASRDIKNKQTCEESDDTKILIQLEINYGHVEKNDLPDIIHDLKMHFENDITIPETEKIKFKHLDKVGISKIIQ